MTLVLHNFFRSSTSTRLRVALNFKGLAYDYESYVLRDGEHTSPSYLKKNPAGLVPTLEIADNTYLTQSLAIIEWLEETHPTPSLLPTDAMGRARARSLSYMLACEIHPLNNLRVLNYIRNEFGADEDGQKAWFRHWVKTTFDPLEQNLRESSETGLFCHGDSPTLPDVCLYAQVWNNRRFDISVDAWPTIARIFDELNKIEAFSAASPPQQPDATN